MTRGGRRWEQLYFFFMFLFQYQGPHVFNDGVFFCSVLKQKQFLFESVYMTIRYVLYEFIL